MRFAWAKNACHGQAKAKRARKCTAIRIAAPTALATKMAYAPAGPRWATLAAAMDPAVSAKIAAD